VLLPVFEIGSTQKMQPKVLKHPYTVDSDPGVAYLLAVFIIFGFVAHIHSNWPRCVEGEIRLGAPGCVEICASPFGRPGWQVICNASVIYDQCLPTDKPRLAVCHANYKPWCTPYQIRLVKYSTLLQHGCDLGGFQVCWPYYEEGELRPYWGLVCNKTDTRRAINHAALA
jgi:hypothetical protein